MVTGFSRKAFDSTHQATCSSEEETGNHFFGQLILMLLVLSKSLWTIGSTKRRSMVEVTSRKLSNRKSREGEGVGF